jgi:RimJ/RimL family protein N-acetyltransferase
MSSPESGPPGQEAQVVCESARLFFRELRADDAEALSELYFDPMVVRYLKKGTVFSPEELQEFIAVTQRHYQQHGYGRWAIIEKGTHQLVGCCGITNGDDNERLVTCHVLRRLWHCGYGTEALAAAIDYARAHLPDACELYAYVHVDNAPSRRMLSRLGFDVVAHVQENQRRKLKVRLLLRTP